jgi:hypothetical protein
MVGQRHSVNGLKSHGLWGGNVILHGSSLGEVRNRDCRGVNHARESQSGQAAALKVTLVRETVLAGTRRSRRYCPIAYSLKTTTDALASPVCFPAIATMLHHESN